MGVTKPRAKDANRKDLIGDPGQRPLGYLTGTSDVLPEALLFGLAPIESRVVDEVLGRFVDEEARASTPRPDLFS